MLYDSLPRGPQINSLSDLEQFPHIRVIVWGGNSLHQQLESVLAGRKAPLRNEIELWDLSTAEETQRVGDETCMFQSSCYKKDFTEKSIFWHGTVANHARPIHALSNMYSV